MAVESFTDPATWAELVERVRRLDPQRAANLGPRPAGLVYAMHRSNGTMTPDNLFTFARSELAAAATMLARLGIPMQVAVIP